MSAPDIRKQIVEAIHFSRYHKEAAEAAADAVLALPVVAEALRVKAALDAESDWLCTRPELEWEGIKVNTHNELLRRLRSAAGSVS